MSAAQPWCRPDYSGTLGVLDRYRESCAAPMPFRGERSGIVRHAEHEA